MRISEYLKIERNKKGLTQEEMAKKLGVSRCTYVTYENAWFNAKRNIKRVPHPKVAKRIARLTGCTLDYVNTLIENERREK